MSSSQTRSQELLSSSNEPTLPPNVLIFSPTVSDSAQALLNGRIFTRLTVSSAIQPSLLAAALNNKQSFQVNETFSLCHRNVVLIFDAESEGKDLQDEHHEHFRTVCLALKHHDISLDVASCVFDAPNIMQAGFQLDKMSSGSILVIDIMDSGNDEDNSDDENQDIISGDGVNTKVEGIKIDGQSRLEIS